MRRPREIYQAAYCPMCERAKVCSPLGGGWWRCQTCGHDLRIPHTEEVSPARPARPSPGSSWSRLLLALGIVVVVLVAAGMASSHGSSTSTGGTSGPTDSGTDAPAPILGDKQAVFTSYWGAPNDAYAPAPPTFAYGACPDAPQWAQETVEIGTAGRATLIHVSNCTGQRSPVAWQDRALGVLPADVVQVGVRHCDADAVSAHATSATLAAELGSPDLTINADPTMNHVTVLAGWVPMC